MHANEHLANSEDWILN